MVAQSADEAPEWKSKYCGCKGCGIAREEGRQEMSPKIEELLAEKIRLQKINEFLRFNTIDGILNKLIYLKEQNGNIDHAIELVRCMKK